MHRHGIAESPISTHSNSTLVVILITLSAGIVYSLLAWGIRASQRQNAAAAPVVAAPSLFCVSVGAGGDMVAAWPDPQTNTLLAAGTVESSWSSPIAVPLEPGWSANECAEVKTAMTATGAALVAVLLDRGTQRYHAHRNDRQGSVLVVRELAQGAAQWSETRVLAASTAGAIAFPRLCADANGGALLLWTDGADTMQARWSADSGWSEPRRIDGVCATAGLDMAMNSRGDCVVVWAEPVTPGSLAEWTVRSRRRAIDGEWAPIREVACVDGYVRQLGVTLDEAGCARAQWLRGPLLQGSVERAIEVESSAWRMLNPIRMPRADPDAQILGVTSVAGGNGISAIAWVEDRALAGHVVMRLRVECRDALLAERTWVYFDDALPPTPNLALNPDGSTLLCSWIAPEVRQTNVVLWSPGRGFVGPSVLGGGSEVQTMAIACGGGANGDVGAVVLWPMPPGCGFLAYLRNDSWQTIMPTPALPQVPERTGLM